MGDKLGIVLFFGVFLLIGCDDCPPGSAYSGECGCHKSVYDHWESLLIPNNSHKGFKVNYMRRRDTLKLVFERPVYNTYFVTTDYQVYCPVEVQVKTYLYQCADPEYNFIYRHYAQSIDEETNTFTVLMWSPEQENLQLLGDFPVGFIESDNQIISVPKEYLASGVDSLRLGISVGITYLKFRNGTKMVVEW